MRSLLALSASLFLVGCGSPVPDRVELALAPDVISSLSGVLGARATVLDGLSRLSGWSVQLTVDYKDRNGAAHAITAASAKSDTVGDFANDFSGLTWEGSGTLTAAVLDAAGAPAVDANKAPIVAKASFSVLDESPPSVTITAPTAGMHVPRGRYNVTVNVADEIGVSQVYIQAVNHGGGMAGGGNNNNADRTRSTILASGTASSTVTLEFNSEGANVGDTIFLYSMAADMSGNLAVASSISIIVDPPAP